MSANQIIIKDIIYSLFYSQPCHFQEYDTTVCRIILCVKASTYEMQLVRGMEALCDEKSENC